MAIFAGNISGSSLTGSLSYTSLTSVPTGIVSSSTQIAASIPTGTVSSSGQVDYNSITNKLSGVVSSSAQVAPLLPNGTVSSSGQVDYNSITNKLSGVVSSSAQFNALSGTSASYAATASNLTGGAAVLGANTFTAAQEWATGTAIASAATVNLNTATGNRVHITGTTAITAVTLTRGPRTVIFDGILTLTHNATTNNLPGAANITTAVGDRAVYESDGTTVYCSSYTKASGLPVVSAAAGFTLGTPTATTSGTSFDYTGIPATARQIIVNFKEVSESAGSTIIIQLGDSGGIETSGYLSATSTGAGATRLTTGFIVSDPNSNSILNGSYIFTCENTTANTWCGAGTFARSDASSNNFNAGTKSLSATLDRVRITTVAGTGAFDSGEINIAYI